MEGTRGEGKQKKKKENNREDLQVLLGSGCHVVRLLGWLDYYGGMYNV